ncbi:MAG: bifunctional DNA-formamidopyrimidine glycosylase/DNA-(apurinic or apyrimidinic site) lyase [Anaerolineales bacterium]|jgi:formamidopyrimidine-DNA glycosylase
MPELPEVETIARILREGDRDPSLIGQRIQRVSLHWPRHIQTPSESTFRRRIRNRLVRDVGRRGKFIHILLDRGNLIIHLRMSGDLSIVSNDTPRDQHDHTIFFLENHYQLRFNDVRKFGRVYLVDDEQQIFGDLGPEPLSSSFTWERLMEDLHKRKRRIKSLLLDQTFLAGLGNIYTDEALHRAGVHPLRRSDSLEPDEVQALWKGIRDTLKSGIRSNGASIDWVYRGGEFQNHFRVYQRAGEACATCGSPIERMVIGQRGTHFCPKCQPEASI